MLTAKRNMSTSTIKAPPTRASTEGMFGYSTAVFEGWANGRIRNSIAHSRFTYDDATKKMRFRDIGTKRRPEYDQSFSIVEFSRICIKLDNPFHLVLNLLFIFRIIQLVLNPKVEDAGKKSIFEKWKTSPLYEALDQGS